VRPIGCPEPSVTTNIRCVTTQSSEDLIKESEFLASFLSLSTGNYPEFRRSCLHLGYPVSISEILSAFGRSWLHLGYPVCIWEILSAFGRSCLHFGDPVCILEILSAFGRSCLHFGDPVCISEILSATTKCFDARKYTFSELWREFVWADPPPFGFTLVVPCMNCDIRQPFTRSQLLRHFSPEDETFHVFSTPDVRLRHYHVNSVSVLTPPPPPSVMNFNCFFHSLTEHTMKVLHATCPCFTQLPLRVPSDGDRQKGTGLSES
jgi:hypothetical protein